MVSVDIQEQPVIEPKNVIGVDMGIVNIAVDSTGKYYSGEKVKEIRELINCKYHSLIYSTTHS